MNELAPPPAVKESQNAVELLRAWIIDNGLQCSLNIGGFGENELAMWGILLSDIARHVADAHHNIQGTDAAESLRVIAEHFNLEIDSPTAPAKGEFQKEQ